MGAAILMSQLQDQKKANYLKAGYANWQQAVALFDVDGRRVQQPRLTQGEVIAREIHDDVHQARDRDG